MHILGFHHIQLAMPKGGEDLARAYYINGLGMKEIAKPAALAARGGVWFESGALRLHLGVDAPFIPARKAHPAMEVVDLTLFVESLSRCGFEVTPDADLPGYRRIYTADPFGNRIEILQRLLG